MCRVISNVIVVGQLGIRDVKNVAISAMSVIGKR